MAHQAVLLFPGQASQYQGMGRELHDSFAEARAVFEEADERLGFALTELCFTGDEAALQLTENTQPAILTVSVAAARVLQARGIEATAVAGHSLGEYSALVAASALAFGDAVEIVRKRGRYMQEAVPVGEGAMAAIIGLDEKAVAELCSEASRGDVVVPANFNSPQQIVVAGSADAVRRALALAEARGARRAVMLPVSAPFHSPLMGPAADRLALELEALELASAEPSVVTNVDADYARSADACRDALRRQVTAPVRWTESIQRLLRDGHDRFIEVGPGKVLSGLVRRIERGVTMANVEDCASLDKTLAKLESAD